MKNLIFSFILIGLLSCLLFSCTKANGNEQHTLNYTKKSEHRNGNTIKSRFPAPEGYVRQESDSASFGFFLRNLPLKPTNTFVKYYNGAVKQNNDVYSAVVDLPIGSKNLHQCADAIIRLRADYLKSTERENEIAFQFTNGFLCDYATWKSGKKIHVNGNSVKWRNGNQYADDYWTYLETIFMYAGTISLSRELKSKSFSDIRPGDVFIQGGSPGHALIVIDQATHPQTGKLLFMLAQSYMPAQEIQILTNPRDKSVWYSMDGEQIVTPEWTFFEKDLKQF